MKLTTKTEIGSTAAVRTVEIEEGETVDMPMVAHWLETGEMLPIIPNIDEVELMPPDDWFRDEDADFFERLNNAELGENQALLEGGCPRRRFDGDVGGPWSKYDAFHIIYFRYVRGIPLKPIVQFYMGVDNIHHASIRKILHPMKTEWGSHPEAWELATIYFPKEMDNA